MRVISFRLRKQRQVAIRQGVDNYSISNHATEAGYLLPTRRVVQELVESQSRQSQGLHGENEAVQQYARTSQHCRAQKQSTPLGCAAVGEQKSRKQAKDHNLREQDRQAKWFIAVILPRSKTHRRRSEVQPD